MINSIWAGHKNDRIGSRTELGSESRSVNLCWKEIMASLDDSPVARPRSSQGKRDCPDLEDGAEKSASKKIKQVRVWVDGW